MANKECLSSRVLNAEWTCLNKTNNCPVQISEEEDVDIGKMGYTEIKYGVSESIKNDSWDNIQKFDRILALHESNKVKDLDTFRNTEIIAYDDIQNLVPQETNGTEEHTIIDHKLTNQLDTSGFDGSVNDHHLRELADKFLLSIEEKTANERKSFLASQNFATIWPLLVLILNKAEDDGKTEIVTTIQLYIKDKSSEIVKQYMSEETFTKLKEASVWLGTECLCKKAEEIKYENKLCNKSKPLLIVEVDGDLKSSNGKYFCGFEIKKIPDSSSRRNESRVVAERQLPTSRLDTVPESRLHKVPKSVAKELFKKHSNLTMVCPSAFKSKGFGIEEHTVMEIDCISLFCRIKGIIPIGERHFPLKINGFQTDVFEGISYFTSAVHIGDKIYNSEEEFGTLGGFVKYYGIDTFLTCAHVIFGKSNISNLQTKDIHFNCHTMKNDNKKEPVKCTLIRHILKYDTEESKMVEDDMESEEKTEETSIDAALVLIQMPTSFDDSMGNCSAVCRKAGTQDTESTLCSPKATICSKNPVELRIKLQGYGNCTEDKLTALGLKSIYLNENFIDTEVKHSMAIALSAITGKQESFISVNKSKTLSVIVPGGHARINTNIMYNQFVIKNMDFEEGDSGTCIYTQFTGSEEKGCIGMLIGKSTSGEYIVTPMKEILKALKVDSKS